MKHIHHVIENLMAGRPEACHLAKALAKQARATHRRMARARAVGFEAYETTLTDLLLTELAHVDPRFWRVVRFKPHEERANGADWEWWIQRSDSSWVRLWIQAKRLYHPGERYEELKHKVRRGSDGRIWQSRLLVEAARREGRNGEVPPVPLYAFYNCLQGKRAEPWPCTRLEPCQQQPLLGITIAPAQQIDELVVKGKNGYCDVLAESKPLSCLVHCPTARSGHHQESYASTLLMGMEGLHSNDVLSSTPSLPGRIEEALEADDEVVAEESDPRIALITGHAALPGARMDEVPPGLADLRERFDLRALERQGWRETT
ncbi:MULTISPECIES: DUF6615 family protein [Streptomyces]|uniref:DUF6615 family protein n=1 Tax=Streptomyces TaxID=1883 RepID=UPI001A93A92C|nr:MULTISPECIES: DUF6615 family protein [Streptomyces]MBO0914191.1 hypothetical protein [Streptomyces laculatispora]MDF6066183.1 hypothetical protein [Streptomyces sp. JH010]WSS88044.1 hypothetical protein OG199_35900 [Streptomyces sp. NBC_01176]